MASSHPRRGTAVLGVAGGGLVLGHWLTYALATPHAHAREDLLDRTGHAYLPFLTEIAVVVAMVALAALFLGRLMRGDRGRSTAATAARLTAFQMLAFIGMEVVERLVAGAPLAELTHGLLLPLGLLVQMMIAGAGALVLRWTLRAADLVETSLRGTPPFPRPVAVALAPVAVRRPALPALATAGIRGPPAVR